MVPTHAVMLSVSPVVWITVIVILVVVFGAAKLPEIARNVGKSAKVLKEELKDLSEDEKPAAPATPSASSTPEAPQVQAPTQAPPKPENPEDQSIPHQGN